MENFFVGCKPWTLPYISSPSMLSMNAIKHSKYKKLNIASCALIDSGAFTLVSKFGGYPLGSLCSYVSDCLFFNSSRILAFVSQDYMCEHFILSRTGFTLQEHQRYTIYRFKALKKLIKDRFYLMPVLQGYQPEDYVSHLCQYGDLLSFGAWVGVGSVCKRNSNVSTVYEILSSIKNERPDLRLHGFGLKKTAFSDSRNLDLLFSADSFAWSYSARKNSKDSDSSALCENYYFSIKSLCDFHNRPALTIH